MLKILRCGGVDTYQNSSVRYKTSENKHITELS